MTKKDTELTLNEQCLREVLFKDWLKNTPLASNKDIRSSLTAIRTRKGYFGWEAWFRKHNLSLDAALELAELSGKYMYDERKTYLKENIKMAYTCVKLDGMSVEQKEGFLLRASL